MNAVRRRALSDTGLNCRASMAVSTVLTVFCEIGSVK